MHGPFAVYLTFFTSFVLSDASEFTRWEDMAMIV